MGLSYEFFGENILSDIVSALYMCVHVRVCERNEYIYIYILHRVSGRYGGYIDKTLKDT